MKSNQVWVKLIDRETGYLIRYIYNPYHRKPNDVKKDWILPEHWKTVGAIATK
jgi:predicted oxidoreductase (fatty acid repression mutant protein)